MKMELVTNVGSVVLDFDKILDLCADFDVEPEEAIADEFYRKTKLELSDSDLARVAAEYRKYEAEIFEIWDTTGEVDEF